MAIYEYRCDDHGSFDVSGPLGSPSRAAGCPVCGSDAGRVFTAPMLMRAPRAMVAVIDRAEKSRYEPEVVKSVPPSRKRTPVLPLTPTLRRLPRP